MLTSYDKQVCIDKVQSWTKLSRKLWFCTYCNHNYGKLAVVCAQECLPTPLPRSMLIDKIKLVKPRLMNIDGRGEGVAGRVRY